MRLFQKNLMVGLCCGLVLNMGVAQYAIAEGPSPEHQFTTLSDALAEIEFIQLQDRIFVDLFNAPWIEEDFTYPLDEAVEGLGDYHGMNRIGQDFTLSVTEYQESFRTNPLDPEQTRVVIISGLVQTGLAQIWFSGVAASGVAPDTGEALSYSLSYNRKSLMAE